MGALFGLSIVADLPDVRAAVFALGGVWPEAGTADRENAARNARVRDGARRLGEREILMVNMTRDEHFPIAGALEVLEAIPGPKRMGVWAGTHEELPPGVDEPDHGLPGPHAGLDLSCLRVVVRSLACRCGSSPLPTAARRVRRCGARSRGRRESPLAPVTVVVPGNSVGVAVRRLLASGELGPVSSVGSGLIGVNFLTASRLAELLAAPRLAARERRPVSPPVVAAAVRRVLATAAGMFASVATHPATEEALVAAVWELSDLDDAALDLLRAQSERARSSASIASSRICSRRRGTTSTISCAPRATW